jgi:hypothetical protein
MNSFFCDGYRTAVYDYAVTFMGRNNVMGRYIISVDTKAVWQEVL